MTNSIVRASIAFALVAALGACSGSHDGSRTSGAVAETGSSQPAVVGAVAPSWQAPTTAGNALDIASLRGKAVYLNFFASWCPPCNQEAPDINALQKEYAARGLAVVGVDIMENAAKARQFVNAHRLVYPAVVDSGTLRAQYRINGLPVHVFIDRTGTVRRITVGQLTKTEMLAAIKSIL